MATTTSDEAVDESADWADLTEQMGNATGRQFRLTRQGGLVRLEQQRAATWGAITAWMRADLMELYAEAFLHGIHQGYLAAKRGH